MTCDAGSSFLHEYISIVLCDSACCCCIAPATCWPSLKSGLSLQIFDLPAVELVPGDLVELHVGDKVPADIRLISMKTATVRLEQASLTGEAMPVHKEMAAVAEEDCELQAKENMLFAGTAVVNGHCFGIVNNIGMTTEIGKIQQQIHDAASEEEDTPLKKKLDRFGELLAQVRHSKETVWLSCPCLC